ncbi:hypothetical protein BJY00DRAFT_312275 [Aspergillus carlsbadensis]|nr:hypothetical protein BJY00DRAFT_312275 [Aspergillus carlsbadensis]
MHWPYRYKLRTDCTLYLEEHSNRPKTKPSNRNHTMSESITTLKEQTTAAILAEHTLAAFLALQDLLAACPPYIRDTYSPSAIEHDCSRWLELCLEFQVADSSSPLFPRGSRAAQLDLLWRYMQPIYEHLVQSIAVTEHFLKGRGRGPDCASTYCSPFTLSSSSFYHSPYDLRALRMNTLVIQNSLSALEEVVRTYPFRPRWNWVRCMISPFSGLYYALVLKIQEVRIRLCG